MDAAVPGSVEHGWCEGPVGLRPVTGSTIQTASGRYVDPLNLHPDDVSVEDIAHALAHQCRYSGHTSVFHSVAEHSVRTVDIVPAQDRLWALLHDATEAYLVDLPRPIKYAPGLEEYRKAERRAMLVICERFGLPPEEPDSVRHADLVLLATERRDLMAEQDSRWLALDLIEPLPARIQTYVQPKTQFLSTYARLTAAACAA